MHPASPEPAEAVLPTAEEYEAVHAALRTVARPGTGGLPCTLNSLFEQWDALRDPSGPSALPNGQA
ncbi:hypothetical protein [Streptomyces virginiae]